MLNLRVTLTFLASSAWEYISASSWFSGKLADPMVIAGEEELPVPPPLVGSLPHALSGRIAATTAAAAVSLVNLCMDGTFRRAVSGRCWRVLLLRGTGRRGECAGGRVARGARARRATRRHAPRRRSSSRG